MLLSYMHMNPCPFSLLILLLFHFFLSSFRLLLASLLFHSHLPIPRPSSLSTVKKKRNPLDRSSFIQDLDHLSFILIFLPIVRYLSLSFHTPPPFPATCRFSLISLISMLSSTFFSLSTLPYFVVCFLSVFTSALYQTCLPYFTSTTRGFPLTFH